MNDPIHEGELMCAHLKSCRQIFDRMCIDLASSPAESSGLLEALSSGALTLQVHTTFSPLPSVRGVAVDSAGHAIELFQLAVNSPRRAN